MHHLLLAFLMSVFVINSASAQTPGQSFITLWDKSADGRVNLPEATAYHLQSFD